MERDSYVPGSNGRDEAVVAFSVFVLAHAGCGQALIESRMDERHVACWCLRCDVLCTFGAGDREL